MNEARGQWLNTSQAAAALGVSERTVQRRAANGKIEARKVADDDGERWEVLVEVPTGAAIVPPTVPPGAATSNERESASEAPQSGDSGGTVPPGAAIGAARVTTPETRPEMEAERIAELKAEVMFLRGLVEQRDRDLAETRAAHRTALKLIGAASAPQLTTGTPETPDAAPAATAGNHSHGDASGQQHGTYRTQTGGYDYGAIADKLERNLNP